MSMIVNPYAKTAGAGDPHFSQVQLLVHGPALTDVKGHTLTNLGTTTTSGSPPSGSINSTVLSFPDDSSGFTATAAAFVLGSGDFTWESHDYDTQSSGANLLYGYDQGGSAILHINNWGTVGQIFTYVTAGSLSSTTSAAPTIQNHWRYNCLVRASGVLYIFSDGTLLNTKTGATNNYVSTVPLQFGGTDTFGGPTPAFRGYREEIRVTIGFARYTTTYTPQATPFANS
jgi:hypothetical protein